jgi:two-component system sensor histidine kinase QseC
LLAGTALAMGVVLSASGVLLYVLVRASLLAEFDGALESKVRALAVLVDQEDEVEVELDEQSLPELRRTDRPEYLEVWKGESAVLYRSPSLGERDLARIGGPLAAPAFRSVRLPDGRRGRIAGVRFIPREEQPGRRKAQEATLVLGRETREIDKTLARLRALLVGVGAGAILASVGLLAWVVRRGLQPVSQLAAQIAGVGENDLSARIAGGSAPGELLPVVQRLNDLLARLEAAFSREKAFSADVAHELRTPLAGLRATVEVALSRERDSSAYRDALGDSLGIAVQMQSMVDNLLSLARAEAGQLELLVEPVGLDELLKECWCPLAARAVVRRLRVEWAVDPAVVLQTDRGTLRLILQNLIENAVAYADPAGLVRVQARDRDGRIEVIVANSGSKLTPEQAGHVFERFWRGDAARCDTGVHCGLGLALCQKLMGVLGGSISVRSAVGGMFSVTLTF